MIKHGSRRKGQIWISAILYIMIITVVMTLVLQAGIPVLKDLQDKSIFTRSKNSFLAINQHIQDVAEEGAGSQRVIPIEIEKGHLSVENGIFQWDMRTDAKILESGSEIDLGNLFISSNADVNAIDGSGIYTLSNNLIEANFTKCEDASTCVLNSSSLLVSLAFDYGANTFVASGDFGFELGAGPWSYSGYSRLEDRGSNLGSATVVYYLNNTNSSIPTIIEFTLGSNRDFLETLIR